MSRAKEYELFPKGRWEPPSHLTRGAIQSGLHFRKTTVGAIPFLRRACIGMVTVFTSSKNGVDT